MTPGRGAVLNLTVSPRQAELIEWVRAQLGLASRQDAVRFVFSVGISRVMAEQGIARTNDALERFGDLFERGTEASKAKDSR